MVHPKQFLLQSIINSDKKASTLSQLEAKHIDSLAEVMADFAEQTAIEVINRLNKGEILIIKGNNYTLKS